MDGEPAKEEHFVASISEDHETRCWGCGLRLLLGSYSPVFKCGWCGAITNHNETRRKPDSVCFSRWRHIRDRFFITILLIFVLFVICGGVWAVYPVIFSISFFFGAFHCTIIAILSISTIFSFCLAAFRSAGAPANVQWGNYETVGKGGLDNYTFCSYCAKPKSPRAHHCRSCRMCVLDMDHHCPFIGNCVGAANHCSFVAFLISIVISCAYVVSMSVYAGLHLWPPINLGDLSLGFNLEGLGILRLVLSSLARSLLLSSARGLVLLYLAFASISVEIGIGVLLWQQLCFIYKGNTYINSISSENKGDGEKGYHNLLRFFGCPYSAFRFLGCAAHATKLQESLSSKLL